METTEKRTVDPFLKTVYQLAMHEAGQLTSDELRVSLQETVPLMKAALDAQEQPEQDEPPQPQY